MSWVREAQPEFLKSNSLLISAPKSTVTHFTLETKQAKYHPDIKIAGSQLLLNRSPKILGVHLDTSLTFNVHSTQAATRHSNRNNVLKALAGTTWRQQKEAILMTYKATTVPPSRVPMLASLASERFRLRRTRL